MGRYRHGFTIVELLIVIAVIGLLATISIVAYSNVQSKARASALQANLNQIYKKAQVFSLTEGRYPATLSEIGINNSSSITYQYQPNSTTAPTSYCLQASTGGVIYKIPNSASNPVEGTCSVIGGIIASAENPPGETGLKAFDNSVSTKWLAFSVTAWIEFSTTEPITITAYSISSANDEPNRDPRSWTLSGSHDRISWTTIDSRSNITFASRHQTLSFNVTGAPSYQNYRLSITQNNGSGASTQLSEIAVSGATIINN